MTTKIIEETLKNQIREYEEAALNIIDCEENGAYEYYIITLYYHKARALSETMYELFGYFYSSLNPEQRANVLFRIETLITIL